MQNGSKRIAEPGSSSVRLKGTAITEAGQVEIEFLMTGVGHLDLKQPVGLQPLPVGGVIEVQIESAEVYSSFGDGSAWRLTLASSCGVVRRIR